MQPANDRYDTLTRLGAAEPLPLAHLTDDRRVLEDTFGQFGLAQAVLTMQMLAHEIAERVAHVDLMLVQLNLMTTKCP